MLDKMIEWGKREEAVKALFLLGSRANKGPTDQFSDYDIAVFCTTDAPYISSVAWLSEFGPVFVAIHEKVIYYGDPYPSRLVIFEGGVKVDFSFLSMMVLGEMIRSQELPDEFQAGYRLLLNKEDKVIGLPEPQFAFKAKKPSEEEFQTGIEGTIPTRVGKSLHLSALLA